MITDLFLAYYVAIATPFYESGKWLIEQTEPYMPLGKSEKFGER